MAKRVRLSKGALGAKVAFDEAKHRRGPGGKFADKPGAGDDAPSGRHSAKMKAAGKTSGIKADDIIKVHVAKNPKVAGSASAVDFAHYKNDMTVAQFKAAVGPKASGHISHDLKKGYISVHAPGSLPKAKKELSKESYVAAGKQTGIKGDDVIKLHPSSEVGKLVNPKKAGSKSAADFAKYKDEMTVDDFAAAVGDKKAALAHIAHDKGKGFVSVHSKTELAALRTGKTPEPPVAQPKQSAEPKPSLYKEDDLIQSVSSKQIKTAAEWKKGWKEMGNSDAASSLENAIAKGGMINTTSKGPVDIAGMKVSPGQKLELDGPTGGLKDTDVLVSAKGVPYKVGYLKKLGYTEAGISAQLKAGSLKMSTPKTSVADLKSTDELSLVTSANPYQAGTHEWIKFQAFKMNAGKPLSKSAYDATKSLTPAEKSATLQKLMDDGHVVLVAPGQNNLIAGAKSASPYPIVDHEPAKDFKSDDPKWSKVLGVPNVESKNSGSEKIVRETRDALGAVLVPRKSSDALYNYKGSGYETRNANLRKGNQPSKMDREMDLLMKPTAGSAYMYRGHDNAMMNNLPPPADYVDLGYTSVSFKPDIARSFSKGSMTVFRIRVPKGARALHIGTPDSESELMMEAEVVLARSTRFRHVQTTQEGKWKVHEVEVVKEDGSPY